MARVDSFYANRESMPVVLKSNSSFMQWKSVIWLVDASSYFGGISHKSTFIDHSLAHLNEIPSTDDRRI